MAERQGIERLSALQRRWKAESIAYCLLLGLAVSVVLASALAFFWGWNWWVGVVFLALSFHLKAKGGKPFTIVEGGDYE